MDKESGLVFKEDSHQYFKDGCELVSVTKTLAPISDYDFVPPDVLAYKAALGTEVHHHCHVFNCAEFDLGKTETAATISDHGAGYFRAYMKFVEDVRLEVIASELKVWSERGYAGALDEVAIPHALKLCKPSVIDLKCTTQIQKSADPQTAAYEAAYREREGIRIPMPRFVCKLMPNGNYRLQELTHPLALACFYSCLTINRFKNG